MSDKGRQLPLIADRKCPTIGCLGGPIQFHSKAMWCNTCGWAINRYPSPGEGYIENKVRL